MAKRPGRMDANREVDFAGRVPWDWRGTNMDQQ